jgi:hypothetical protein
VPLVLYTVVTFLVWLYLARVNLDRRQFFRLRWRPAWTVAGWFVPVVNIYLPPLVLGWQVAWIADAAPAQQA